MVKLDLLKEWLLSVEECQLCELLAITSEDLVSRFEDVIISRRRILEMEMEVLDSSMEEDELDFDDE